MSQHTIQGRKILQLCELLAIVEQQNTLQLRHQACMKWRVQPAHAAELQGPQRKRETPGQACQQRGSRRMRQRCTAEGALSARSLHVAVLAGKSTNVQQTSCVTGSEHEPVAHGPARQTAPHAQCARQGTVHGGLTSTIHCLEFNAPSPPSACKQNGAQSNRTEARRPPLDPKRSFLRSPCKHGSRSKTPRGPQCQSHRCKAAPTCHAGMQPPPRCPAKHTPN